MLAVATQICQFAVPKSTQSQMWHKTVIIQHCREGKIDFFSHFLVGMTQTVNPNMAMHAVCDWIWAVLVFRPYYVLGVCFCKCPTNKLN